MYPFFLTALAGRFYFFTQNYFDMRNYYLLLFFLCWNTPFVFSQITLTTANNPVVGENYSYNTIIPNIFDGGDSGANVTWDFSNIAGASNSISEIKDPATFPNGNLFPNSNIGVTTAGLNSESYYYSSDVAMGFYGAISANTRIIYTDPQDWVRYPMTYLDNYTDTFDGTVETTALFNRGGTAEVTADAYGTLITPSGTFTNVLRVHTYMDYGDEFNGAPLIDYTETRYLWYDVETGFPLMTYSDLESYTLSVFSLSYLDATPLSVRSPLAKEIQLSVFPNPATDWLNIDYSLSNQSQVAVSVVNLLGKEVIQISNAMESLGAHQAQIEVSELARGIYFVKMIVGNEIATHKVSIER